MTKEELQKERRRIFLEYKKKIDKPLEEYFSSLRLGSGIDVCKKYLIETQENYDAYLAALNTIGTSPFEVSKDD